MKHLAIWLFTLFFWGQVGASESLNIEFYEVHGESRDELRRSLEENGPIGESGDRYHGYTKWNIGWNFKLTPSGRQCRITDLTTKLEVTMTLPRWNKPDNAPKDLAQEWDRYSTALRQHEDGHQNMGISAAEEIKQRLSGLTGTGGCQKLAEDMNSKANAVIAEFNAKELAYDATTEHGATQGARF